MLNFLKSLFLVRAALPCIIPDPEPGETYRVWSDKNPFEPEIIYTVLAVKDGWVKFKSNSGFRNKDYATVKSFKNCYYRWEEPKPLTPLPPPIEWTGRIMYSSTEENPHVP